MKCKDCKFWGADSAWNLAFLPQLDGYRDCDHPSLLALGHNDDGAGTLSTSPDFGCIQFEAK